MKVYFKTEAYYYKNKFRENIPAEIMILVVANNLDLNEMFSTNFMEPVNFKMFS